MLHEFVTANRDEIILRCRAKVAARSIPPPTAAEIDSGVPLFLDQLADALRLGTLSSPQIGRSATRHGHNLRLQGFTVSQVVHDYGDVCQAITQLAVEMGAPITAADFRLLNACLDDAIALAVTQYTREGNQIAVDDETARGTERLGFFAHELRNLINVSIIAFEVLKTGNVGVAGSTGTVLHRSLVALNDLVARSLAEVRLTQGIQNSELLLARDFIAEIEPAARLAAGAARVKLDVQPVDGELTIEADRNVLSAVMSNLLQNAYKFTKPETTVSLLVRSSADRVLIEVHDECGGLPDGDSDALFRSFEQRGADRTGLGLGLPFSRWGAEANGGRVYARNLPGVGCVFTLDLPRISIAELAT